METQETVLEPVIHELGPECSEITAIVQDGEASWAVQFEDGAVVNLMERPQPPRTEMMTWVGHAPKGTREDVVRCLLMFNFLSADTGGARMGLGALDDAVYLIRDLPHSGLTTQSLQAEMQAFVAVAARWREFIEKAASSSELPPFPTEALGIQA